MVRTLVVALALSISVGCVRSYPVNTTPQAKVADYATSVMTSLTTITKAAADLNAQGILPDNATAQVMIVGNKAGRDGQELAAMLKVYDTASAEVKAAMTKDINTKILVIGDAVTSILAAAPIPDKFKVQAATFLSAAEGVLQTLTSIKTLLPQGI